MSQNDSFLGYPAFESRLKKKVFIFPKYFRSILMLRISCLENTCMSFPRGKATGA